MEHDPASGKVHGGLRGCQHELRYQYQHYEPYVAAMYAYVDKRLCQKRKYQLQHTREQHSRREQEYLAPVGFEIAEEEAERAPAGIGRIVAALHVGFRGEGEHCSAAIGSFASRSPASQHFLLAVDEFFCSRVGDVETSPTTALRHPVAHHEMPLVPVEYARHRHFFGECVDVDLHGFGAEAYGRGGLADAEHRHAVACDVAQLPESGERIFLAVVSGYHPQACGAAVHCVELSVVWKGAHDVR